MYIYNITLNINKQKNDLKLRYKSIKKFIKFYRFKAISRCVRCSENKKNVTTPKI